MIKQSPMGSAVFAVSSSVLVNLFFLIMVAMNSPMGGVMPPMILAHMGPLIPSAPRALAAMDAVLLTGPPISKPMQAPITAPITDFAPPFKEMIHCWNTSMIHARGIEKTHRKIMPQTSVDMTGMNITGISPSHHLGSFHVFIQFTNLPMMNAIRRPPKKPALDWAEQQPIIRPGTMPGRPAME